MAVRCWGRASAVGTAHTHVEGRDKVAGAARYAGEVPFTGLVHGWLALATVARGRIRAIESADALARPGVLAVPTHENAPRVETDYTGLMGLGGRVPEEGEKGRNFAPCRQKEFSDG